jgi:CRP/FNR family transcriptional regulator, anaerobic regulatory protein
MRNPSINFKNIAPDVIALFEQVRNLISVPNMEELALILPFVKYKTFKKGESILKVGEISEEVYFNAKGIARSYSQLPNGTEKTYYIMIEHTIFSDYASLISQTPATENIEALEDMEVYYILQTG